MSRAEEVPPLNPFATAQAADTCLFWISPEGRLLDASEPACRTLGYSRPELQRLAVWDVDPAFPAAGWPEHWQELRRARMLQFQTTHRHRDGTRFLVEVLAHYLEFQGQEYNCALVYPLTPQRQTEQALRESEERLALALAVSGQGLYDLDLTTGRAVFSDEYARMLGYEPSELELTLENWTSWLHPDDRGQTLQIYEDCVTNRQPDYQTEFRLRRRSGDWIWVRSVGKVVQHDATGRPLRMVGTHLDITERKQNEEALKLTQIAIDRVFVGIFWFDDTGTLLYVNDQGCRSLGYRREELIGAKVARFDPNYPSERRAELWAHLRTAGSFTFESRHRRKDGSDFPVEITSNYIAFAGKEYNFAFVRDITARQQAEAARRASEAFLDSIIDQSPLPIVVYDMVGRVVRNNHACRALFQLAESPDEHNLFQDEQLREQGHLPLFERVFRQGETVRLQSRYDVAQLRASASAGQAHWLELDSTVFPVRDASGDITHAVVYHLDITDLKAAETRLRYHLDLEQAVAEISALMIRPGWEDFDDRVHWLLERIGRLAQADRSYLFRVMPDGLTMSNTHEWCAAGIPAQYQDLQNLRVADYQPFHDQLQQGMIELQTASLPDESLLKPLLLAGGVRGLLCVPVCWNERLHGFIGLDAVTRDRHWEEGDVRLLRMVAEILAHTLQHIESDRTLRANARFLEDLDRISRILTRRGRDIDLIRELVAAILDIFQADRAYFLHPCDPDAPSFRVRMEATRPEWPGIFASVGGQTDPAGVTIIPDETFRCVLRQVLAQRQPVLSSFVGGPGSMDIIRPDGIQSQMAMALHPQADQPWLLGLHQCAYARHWTDAEQRLFQAIAERVSDALSGHLLLQQLQASEERFSRAFHASPAPMVISVIDTGCFLDVNERWLQLVGHSRAETIGQTSIQLGIWADSGTREGIIARLRRDGSLRDEAVRLRTKGGRILEVLWSAEFIRLADQEVMLSLVYDVTDRQRAEEELQRYQNHLEDLVAERTNELRQAMTQLVQAEKLAALGHLVAGVAHELNTPLGNARMVASTLSDQFQVFRSAMEAGTLRRSQLTDFLQQGREAVDLLERNTVRAANLISHFKQIAVDQTSMRRRPFDLRQTIEETLATLRPTFKHTSHRLTVTIPSELVLDSYPGPLEQVIANLLTNSLTHGFADRTDGAITITAQVLEPGQVILRFQDDGVGIQEALRPRIFEPFFTTRLGQGGSGLGLYIVYNLVTGVLGGTIAVDSPPGQGTAFTLTLPRAAPDHSAAG